MSELDAREHAARIGLLLDEVRALAEPAAVARVEELVQRLMRFYGAGFTRLLGHARELAGTRAKLHEERISADEVIASLLVLHDLRPPPAEERDLVKLGGLRASTGPSCELCAASIGEHHPHVVDLDKRNIRCACAACAMLFRGGAVREGARFRTVPDRVRVDPAFAWGGAEWSRLGIPVQLAFLFVSSSAGRWVAVYPGPAGATESELSDEAEVLLGGLRGVTPLVATLEPDVEALLVRSRRGEAALDCYLAPIDVCYELVGAVRTSWVGFDGGDDARREIDGFFDRLRGRAQPMFAGGRP